MFWLINKKIIFFIEQPENGDFKQICQFFLSFHENVWYVAHWICLIKLLQMTAHNICFYWDIFRTYQSVWKPSKKGYDCSSCYSLEILVFYAPVYLIDVPEPCPECHSKVTSWADPEGGTGGRTPPPPPPPPPLKNHKNIGFLSNTGPDPLRNHKATKPAFNVGPSSARQWNAI